VSINKAIIVGHVGKAPELKHGKTGAAFCSFTVATQDNTSKDKEAKVDWHNVVAFGKTAEACAKYIGKGHLVYIEGRISYKSWEKDGKKFFGTDILASHVEFLEKKPLDSAIDTVAQAMERVQYTPPPAPQPTLADITTEDIPF